MKKFKGISEALKDSLVLMLRKFKTAFHFSLEEWKIFGRAYFLLLKAQILLFFIPLQSVEKVLLPPSPSPLPPWGRGSRVRGSKAELLQFFKIAWRYQLKKPNCLPTSLALHAFLNRYSFPSQLRIGIRKEDGKLKAHAWVEIESASPVIEGCSNFIPLCKLTHGS